MGFTSRDFQPPRRLQPVPDLPPDPTIKRYMQDFERTIQGVHIFNGVGRAEREVKHLIAEANEAEYESAAACLENALTELETARMNCK